MPLTPCARPFTSKWSERSGDGNLLERPCLHVVTSQPLCLLHQHHAAWRRPDGARPPSARGRYSASAVRIADGTSDPCAIRARQRCHARSAVAARFTARSVRVAVGNSTSALSAPLSARRTPGQSGGCSCHCERSGRGRDGDCSPPPAQIPACGFPAPGSCLG